jgi:hypothetical protein
MMQKRDWAPYAAAVGAAIAALALTWALTLNHCRYNDCQRRDGAERSSDSGQASMLPPDAGFHQGDPQQRATSQRQQPGNQPDSGAEESIAAASWAQIALNVLGLIGLGFTVWFARKAWMSAKASAEASKDALTVSRTQLTELQSANAKAEFAANRQFIAQHRPHMYLKQMHMTPLVAGCPVMLKYWAINQGHTSATEIRHCHAFVVSEHREGRGFPNYKGGKDVLDLSVRFEPGRREIREETGPAFDADQIRRINAGEVFLIAFGYFSYADDNDAYWSRAFWRVLNPKTLQLEGVEDGEYEYTE